jgi:DnaJ-class molecular chaperone
MKYECGHCFEGRVPCRACDGAGAYPVTEMDAAERVMEDCGACGGTGERPCSVCTGTGEIGADLSAAE